MKRPSNLNGLRHLALLVSDLSECEKFYVNILGMQVLFRVSNNLIYLTCGNDNLSLRQIRSDDIVSGTQALDHFGFVVDSIDDLQAWYDYLTYKKIDVQDQPHDHQDGARSFHFTDPSGNLIQALFHPSISGQRFSNKGEVAQSYTWRPHPLAEDVQ